MEQPISIREYARRRNVSDTAVRKAINSGKIERGRVFNNGVPAILESIANEEWAQYAPQVREPKPAKKPNPITPTPAQPVKPTVNPTPSAPATAGEVPPPAKGTIAAARLVKEQLNAKLLEIELKEKMGKLVDKDRVYSALFNAGKELRVSLQTIPDRYIDDILAAPGRNEAHTILYKAISEVLDQIAELGRIDVTKATK